MTTDRIEAFCTAFARRDGDAIAVHRDVFGFGGWPRRALGLPGLLLGWTPFLRNKVRKMAHGRLEAFMRTDRG